MRRLILLVLLVAFARPVTAQTTLLSDLQAERTKYPTPIAAADIAKVLNAVAWAHRAEGWGLLKKGAGNSCPLAGTFISCDILINSQSKHHFDVLQNAEGDGTGTAIPQWNDDGICELGPTSGCEMSRFLAPVDPGGSPTADPAPVPTPQPTIDLTPILNRLKDLEQKLTDLSGELKAQRDALDNIDRDQLPAMRTDIQMLEAKPIPKGCSVPFLGCRLTP
jgi:hypothetical protein